MGIPEQQSWNALLGDSLIALDQPWQQSELALILPQDWSHGLASEPEIRSLAELLGAGATPAPIDRWLDPDKLQTGHNLHTSPKEVSNKQFNSKQLPLAELLKRYQLSLISIESHCPQDSVHMLQLERRLRRQVAEACWPSPERLGRPLPLKRWLSASDAKISRDLADHIVALLHLLPINDKEKYCEDLQDILLRNLKHNGEEGWMRLLEAVVGGINSRQPKVIAVAHTLRQAGLEHASQLLDAGKRGLALVRLLQESLAKQQPQLLETLVESICILCKRMDSCRMTKRLDEHHSARHQLSQIFLGGEKNLGLIRLLLLNLPPEVNTHLANYLTPAASAVIAKGILLIDNRQANEMDKSRQHSLAVALEKAFPRFWWHEELIEKILHDLRRFKLETTWIHSQNTKTLPALIKLYSRSIFPSPTSKLSDGRTLPPEKIDAISEGKSASSRLKKLQLLFLLRITLDWRQRALLLQKADHANSSPLMRLLDGEDEEILEFAVAANMPRRVAELVRLTAEQRGIPDLLPPKLSTGYSDIQKLFSECLDHWQNSIPAPKQRICAPLSVIVTCHQSRLDLLYQALRSISLQSIAVQEVLLIDDGSPQSFASHLYNLTDRAKTELNLPIRLLRQEENLGQYECRNIAIGRMEGKFLVIHDDDDISHPWRLERQWQHIQTGAAAVYCQHIRVEESTSSIQIDGDSGTLFGDGIATLMISKSAALQLGGFYPVRSRGDTEFRSRLVHFFGLNRIARLRQPLYIMRSGDSTASSSYEYNCSLRFASWRRLMKRRALP